jgi:hypothetical protein
MEAMLAIDGGTMDINPSGVRADIIAYEAMRSELEASHIGSWVLVYDRDLVGIYDSFESAAGVAVSKFGKGPYLIRRIGSASVTLPTSVMYGPLHAINIMRV